MAIIRIIIKFFLWLRYRITVEGVDEIVEKGRTGILFLPNHPALIDPVILNTFLGKQFSPRPVADEAQINRFLIRNLARAVQTLAIPDTVTAGAKGGVLIKNVLNIAATALKLGDNILIYPGGHLSHSRFEDLGAASGVESILALAPDVRVVLVKTSGLWGSSFSYGSGQRPVLEKVIYRVIKSVLLNGFFFGPRRRVTIKLHEPDDFPKNSGRAEINGYLEKFYNKDASLCIYVPYTIWERGGVSILPEPELKKIGGNLGNVPGATRKIVMNKLREVSGIDDIKKDDLLARDLGLDSLARAELIIWIGQEFGFPHGDSDSLVTVSDCLLGASGQVISSNKSRLKPVSDQWFVHGNNSGPAMVHDGETIPEVFLKQFLKTPNSVIIADQTSGTKTYRQLVTGLLALKPLIEKLSAPNIGIMLPASVGASTLYLAVQFAGKIPVMINWTVGERNLRHCLKLAGVNHILTARSLVNLLGERGVETDFIKDRFIFIEDMGGGLTLFQKFFALARSYTSCNFLRKTDCSETAVILFTSGSENMPKAVPLSHGNILANLSDIVKGLSLRTEDRLMGILPPFHSFGLTGTLLLPLCTGIRAVYHTNPTEAHILAMLIDSYKVTILVGTPAFLNGIVRGAAPGELASLKMAFSGAEKCPESVYGALAGSSPDLKILEGYGITECSPVVSCNRPENSKPYTIGKVVDSVDYAVTDLEIKQRVFQGEQGMLLVRGPSIFKGYLHYEGDSPFVDFEGKKWYKTGDLVKEDHDNILTFCGRLKRFIKLGGEMISLPAIENVLLPHYASEDQDGQTIAIAAAGNEEFPEIILFTTINVKRSVVNQQIRDGGLSPLHNVRRVVKLDSIPVLGTGKTDYQSLKTDD